MKNTFLSVIAIALVLVSCNQNIKGTEASSTPTEQTSERYACPMHPEVQGKKTDSCSECGMELTEPVVNNSQH